jgi:hypothetical protein
LCTDVFDSKPRWHAGIKLACRLRGTRLGQA